MLTNNYTEKLIGIKDAILTGVETENDITYIDLIMKKREHKCPVCGRMTSKVHDYRTQKVKDAPLFGCHTILRIRKRRHVCPDCGKRFYESIPLVPKYQRTTTRLWAFVINELAEVQSMKAIAKRSGISGTSVARILDNLDYGMVNLPEVISVDEFKGNADGRKFQCILTNPKKHEVLDVLPERNVESIAGYFNEFENHANVRYVVMDLSSIFRSMAQTCFPKACIVADKFHVQRLVTWAFEDMRKTIQKDLGAKTRRYFKKSRFLMLKNKSSLTDDEKERLSVMLSHSKDLGTAYYLLQKFQEVIQSKDKETAKKRLHEWHMHVGATDSERFRRFHTCVNTFIEWNDEILNAFETSLSNGYTEGCNNKIKVIKRNAYGLRNFSRFRKRIMHVMASETESL